MKLYVWEDVLMDWTSGMACVLAENEAHAWDLLKAKDHAAWMNLCNWPQGPEADAPGIPPSGERPKEITEPEAFVVWGGG